VYSKKTRSKKKKKRREKRKAKLKGSRIIHMDVQQHGRNGGHTRTRIGIYREDKTTQSAQRQRTGENLRAVK